jgi:DNA-directed RNA polymerase specialized sigma24 family protein
MEAKERAVASLAEISEAIERLTAPNLGKLRSFATWRMAAIPGSARGRDNEDLLGEAVAATLDGRRKWPKDVTFVNHLLAVMSSTSDNWATRGDQEREVLEGELTSTDPDDEQFEDLLGSVSPIQADQEAQLIAKEVMGALETAVSDDQMAREVLSALQLGMRGQELKDYLGISEEQLRAATRKIHRRAEALQERFAAVPRRKE